MKTNLFKSVSVFFIVSVLATSSFFAQAQSPGGVTDSLQVWVRADKNVTESGGVVSSWDDFSSSFTNTAGSSREPVFNDNAHNFNPGITFTSDYIDLNSLYNFDDFTAGGAIFATGAPSTAGMSGERRFFHVCKSNGNGYFHLQLKNGTLSSVCNSNTRIDSEDTIARVGINSIYGLSFGDGTASSANDSEFLFFNNTTLSTTSNWQTPSNVSRTLRSIGRNATGNYYFLGDMSEVIVYNRELSTTELLKVNSYLALKYGITLDSGKVDYIASDETVIMWDASENTGYTNDVFGLGRDDTDSLYQRVSKSVNSTAVLTVSLLADSFTVSNLDASRTVDAITDLNFMTFSHNGGDTLADNTTGLPDEDNILYGMDRIWRVSATTNFTNDVSLKFDVPGTDSLTYVLYKVSGSDDFSSASYVGELDTAGVINDIQLSNNDYFTLYVVKAPGGVSANLLLWLRADKMTEDWSSNKWFDYRNLDTSTVVNGAVLNTTSSLHNFNPGVTFDGSSYIELWDGFSDFTKGMSAFVFANATEVVNYAYFFTFSTSITTTNHLICFRRYEKSTMLHTLSFDGTLSNTTSKEAIRSYGLTLNEDNIYGSYFTPEKTAYHFKNNAILDEVNNDDSFIIPTRIERTNNFIAKGFGAASGSDVYFKGDIPEVIIYNREISATERQKVDSYLALKYGVTLNGGATDYLASNGTTTMWEVADNTGYINDIFGLGRDDVSSLYQRVSKSADSTGVLTVSLLADSFTVSNLDASREVDVIPNLEFMTFSNNGLDTLANRTTNLPDDETIWYGMNRIWRVSETSTSFPSNVSLKFDVPGVDSLRYMLYKKNNSTDFTSGATYLGALNSEGEINDIQLNNGDYFTLFLAKAPGGVNANVNVWFRADKEVAGSNTAVTAWYNQVPNILLPDSVTAVKKQSVEVMKDDAFYNFNPALVFDGTNYMQAMGTYPVAAISDGTAASVYVVVNNSNQTTGIPFTIYSGTNAVNGKISIEPNNVQWTADNGSTYKTMKYSYESDYPMYDTDGNPHMIDFLYDTMRIANTYHNGIIKTGTAGIEMKNPTATANTYFNLMSNYNGKSHRVTGQLAEVIAYNEANSELEHQKIESYLAIKYGITLDQSTATNYLATNDTVVFDATTKFASYNNNIFGIGTDNTDMLVQKVSQSVSDSTLIIAYDQDFTASNLDASRTALADTTFVIVGDDGADTLFTADYYGKPNHRMNRIWAADVTGDPGYVYVAISATFEFPVGTPVVVVSTDNPPTFPYNATRYALTKADGYYYAKVPVTADTDFYFTFGSRDDNKKYMRHGTYFQDGKKKKMTF